MKCWSNSWFGGPVVLPVSNGTKEHQKQNYIKYDLMHHINVPKEGGYFIMEHVLADDTESQGCYYDIYLLYLPNFDKSKSFVDGNEHVNPRDLLSMDPPPTFEQIKHYMTGFARIIGYREPAQGGCKINFIEEG